MSSVGSFDAVDNAGWRARAGLLTDRAAVAVIQILGSRLFFALVVAMFVFGSLAIAWSMRPSQYDEYMHLGVIATYGQTLLPAVENSAATAPFGDVAHSGSFFFHWLMSFPYRVLSNIWGGDSFTTVAILRTFNVGFVAAGLVVWQRALAFVHASPLLRNLTVWFMSAIPLLPFISATVNYDNLLFLFVACFFFWAFRFTAQVGQAYYNLIGAFIFGVLGSITKYTFVPVFAVLLVWLIAVNWTLTCDAGRWLRSNITKWQVWGTLGAAGLVCVLALSRYGVNLIQFGTPNPSCEKVEAVEYCQNYGPWARNDQFDRAHPDQPFSPQGALGTLITQWSTGVANTLSWIGVRPTATEWLDSYGGVMTTTIMAGLMLLVLVFGVVLSGVVSAKFRGMTLLALLVHGALLFWLNYTDMLKLGVLMAYSARYFFPYLPALIFLALVGATGALRATSKQPHTVGVVCLLIGVVFMSQGGGALTYFNAIDPQWLDEASPIKDLAMWFGKAAKAIVVD